jgi:hypothetical protein
MKEFMRYGLDKSTEAYHIRDQTMWRKREMKSGW